MLGSSLADAALWLGFAGNKSLQMHMKMSTTLNSMSACNLCMTGEALLLWQVCLLGGADDDGQLADAWVLDVGATAWAKLPDAALPAVRAWHSAQMVQTEQVSLTS